METYARELIPRLAALDGLQLTAFVNQQAAEAGVARGASSASRPRSSTWSRRARAAAGAGQAYRNMLGLDPTKLSAAPSAVTTKANGSSVPDLANQDSAPTK